MPVNIAFANGISALRLQCRRMTRASRLAAGFRVLRRHLRYAGINPGSSRPSRAEQYNLFARARCRRARAARDEDEQYADYAAWCARYEPESDTVRRAPARALPRRPLVSILLPVLNPPREHLRRGHRVRCARRRTPTGSSASSTTPRPTPGRCALRRSRGERSAHSLPAPRGQRRHRAGDQRRARARERRVLRVPRPRRHPRARRACSR